MHKVLQRAKDYSVQSAAIEGLLNECLDKNLQMMNFLLAVLVNSDLDPNRMAVIEDSKGVMLFQENAAFMGKVFNII